MVCPPKVAGFDHLSPGAVADHLQLWSQWFRRGTPVLEAGLFVVAALVGLASLASWSRNPWDGFDLANYYLSAARNLSDIYACSPHCYVYSPAFAVAIAPLTLLPLWLALAVWRAAAILALLAATRGLGWIRWVIFLAPGLWSSDLVSGNTNALALSAMVAVVRWPSVRTVLGYAVVVALIPKPQFLPVLAYGMWRVPQARLWGLAVGTAGLAMLAWPGYFDNLARQTSVVGTIVLPQPWTATAAIALTAIGLRFHRILGLAAVAAAPYLWSYTLMFLALGMVPAGRPSLAAMLRKPE